MRVLHVIGAFNPKRREGGLQEATLRLCQGLQSQGVAVEIAATNAGQGRNLDVPLDHAVEVDGVPVRYFQRSPRVGFLPSFAFAQHLHRVAGEYDLFHVCGLFTFPTAAASRVARQRGIPYLVTPSGMCRPWALAYRGYKKRAYWRAVERRTLAGAAAVHATSDDEARDLEALLARGHRCPRIFTVPNAIARVPTPHRVTPRPGRIVFLGRLHPIKGLDVTVDAMSRLTRRVPDAELVVAGPDEVNLWPELVARMRQAKPRPRVTYLGQLGEAAKSELLASASALVLASHSESFGMVVAEALAHGTPVVVSEGCPWRILEETGAGRQVPGRPEPLAAALFDVLTRPDGAEEMRRAAREVARGFFPNRIGSRMKNCYEAILDEPSRRD